ncbi:MAG TPA: hypothetical protein VGJ26_00465 [Pirellulales bacterium]
MHYLYGSKNGAQFKLVATFDSEQQLLAYVHWATLKKLTGNRCKFEQGSALVGFNEELHSSRPLTSEDTEDVLHNPSPSML